MQAPRLIKPNKGTKNQNIGSCDPSNKSFFVKSIADSVALDCGPKRSVACRGALDKANEAASMLRPRNRRGRDVREHRFVASMKVMKMPVFISMGLPPPHF